MVLKLDPRHPLVWRSPTSLQIGVEAPRVVLHDVTSADERMIAALGVGISESGLAMVAASAGAPGDSVATLLGLLDPVLAASAPATRAAAAVVGSGPTADRVAEYLRDDGLLVRLAGTDDAAAEPSDIAVAVGQYVLAPAIHGVWLRLDVPHLPVVVSDGSVSIGPLVEPGIGPCLYCLQRYRTDADPAWPAIAAQLWGRHAVTETRRAAAEAAAIASHVVLERLERGHAASVHTSFELTVATGRLRTTEWLPHPECGCIAVAAVADPEVSARARAGSDWPGAAPRGTYRPRSTRRPPTTSAASGGLA